MDVDGIGRVGLLCCVVVGLVLLHHEQHAMSCKSHKSIAHVCEVMEGYQGWMASPQMEDQVTIGDNSQLMLQVLDDVLSNERQTLHGC